MKRTSKSVFFIVALLILALTYTTFFGVYKYYGDRRDTIIRGAADIRWGIDIKGGIDATFGPGEGVENVTDEQLERVKDVISQRMVGQNITDSELYTDTANQQIIVRFPWKENETAFDPQQAIEELGKTAQLAFYKGSSKTEKDADGKEKTVPAGERILTGDDVESAKAAMEQTKENGSPEPVVRLQLKSSGKKSFADATTELAGNGKISIWLDDEMIEAPDVNSAITDGTCIISGGFSTLSDAASLANLINSGALPFHLEVKSFGTIEPTLGLQALDVMVYAGLIAFILISIYLLFYYRLPGFIAVLSLMGQAAGSIAAVSGYFGFLNSFTLTLPGMAGIILSIGMGVDANVITSERIKEEIRAGRTIDGAIHVGSKSSFWAIFDGNITVIIVAIVLMGVFGPPDGFWATLLTPVLRWFPAATTGSVYSFGYTLFVGIIFNFLVGVTASRLMLKSISRFKFLRKPWLLGGKRA